jgi:hypothetical protein
MVPMQFMSSLTRRPPSGPRLLPIWARFPITALNLHITDNPIGTYFVVVSHL